jgi:PBP1b-binding outer membrane lipoprotein LpoB
MKKLVLVAVVMLVVLLSSCTADEIKSKDDQPIQSVDPKTIKPPTGG